MAVADSNGARAREISAKFNAEHWYKDYRALLEIEEVEAVDICAPTKFHAEIAVAAAKAGKHVLCEKPVALTLSDADRMIHTCAENDVKLMIAHSRRFIPRYQIVRKIITERRIGEPVWATQISRRTMAESGSWYFDPTMTLGPAAEIGIHEADLLRWMFADDVVEVRGIATATGSKKVYEQVFAVLKFKKGIVASFEVGYVLPSGFAQYTTLEVLGSKGLVSASDTHMNVVTHGTESGATYPLSYSELLSVNSAYENEIIAFVSSIINSADPPVTGADARAALEIILATLQSVERDKPVKLPLKEVV